MRTSKARSTPFEWLYYALLAWLLHRILDRSVPAALRGSKWIVRIARKEGYPRLMALWLRIVLFGIILIFAIESKARIRILGSSRGILLFLLTGIHGLMYKARFSAAAQQTLDKMKRDLDSYFGNANQKPKQT